MAAITTLGKRLLKYGTEVGWAAYEALFDETLEFDPADVSWSRVEFHFSRTTPAGTQEDRAITKLDLGSVDDAPAIAPLSAGERATANTILSTMWGSILGRVMNNHALVEYRWYDMRFANPMTPDKRFLERGAPVEIYPDTRTGTDSTTARSIYQASLSVTLKTAARRHWGRLYIPGVAAPNVDTNGRFSAACTDAVRDAFGVAITDLLADGTLLLVPSTQVDGQLQAALLQPHELQVDNVPDVIRKRRPKQASIRDVWPTA
jgi:hypothetical protein